MKYTWAIRSDTGRVRLHNEDAVLPEAGSDGAGEHLVAAIADGMGGAAGGEIASRTAIDAVAAITGDPGIRVEAANLAVVEAAAQRPRLKGMGTTLTLGIFHGDGRMLLGHVGDSRAYRMHQGQLIQETTDHSFVNEMKAAGRMTEAEAEVHPYRSVLTRVVGLDPSVQADVHTVHLHTGDRVLLCSDGLSSMIDDDAIGTILRSASDPASAADELVAAANAAGGADNVSVIVVDAG